MLKSTQAKIYKKAYKVTKRKLEQKVTKVVIFCLYFDTFNLYFITFSLHSVTFCLCWLRHMYIALTFVSNYPVRYLLFCFITFCLHFIYWCIFCYFLFHLFYIKLLGQISMGRFVCQSVEKIRKCWIWTDCLWKMVR